MLDSLSIFSFLVLVDCNVVDCYSSAAMNVSIDILCVNVFLEGSEEGHPMGDLHVHEAYLWHKPSALKALRSPIRKSQSTDAR